MASNRPELRITAKQFDRLPVWAGTLYPVENGAPLDLTGATLHFRARQIGTSRVIGGVATNVAPYTGEWYYEPTAEDTAVAGDYLWEVTVVYPNGKPATWPNDGHGQLRINDSLAS